jgi:hypothetical protein
MRFEPRARTLKVGDVPAIVDASRALIWSDLSGTVD